jgi:hypothetical protein
LHYWLRALLNGTYLLEAAIEEVNLQMERPRVHIGVKIFQIGVVINTFEFGPPAEMLREHAREAGFA